MNKTEKVVFVCCLASAITVSALVGFIFGSSEAIEIKPIQQPDYELVDNEIVNDSLQLAVRFNNGKYTSFFRIWIRYYKVVQDDPFTEEKENVYLTDEILYVDAQYLGWAVYVTQGEFNLDFDKHNTTEFLCKINYKTSGYYSYNIMEDDAIYVYK